MIHASFATYLANIKNGLQVLAEIYSNPAKKEVPFTLEELQSLQLIMVNIMGLALQGKKDLFVASGVPERVQKAFEAYGYKFKKEGTGHRVVWKYHEPKD